MYLTYTEYQEMGGQQPEPAYTRLEYKACMLIDEYTFGRLRTEEEIPEETPEEAGKGMDETGEDEGGAPESSEA